ncbi:hypothetical protein HEP_00266100 [Hepatocystis sp. ex Piliocolobus tephrosceles]|nr:hypothetical protein HEP_00266100 [Hepatocystis sp. ex Piliocolobus tephrosceles]
MNNVETLSDFHFNQKYHNNYPNGYYTHHNAMINRFNCDKPGYYVDARYNLENNNNNSNSNFNRNRFISHNNDNYKKNTEVKCTINNMLKHDGINNNILPKQHCYQSTTNTTRRCRTQANNNSNTKCVYNKDIYVENDNNSRTNKNILKIGVRNNNANITCNDNNNKKKNNNNNVKYSNNNQRGKKIDYESDDDSDQYSDYTNSDIPNNQIISETLINISTNDEREEEEEEEEEKMDEKKTRCKKKFMGKYSFKEIKDSFKLPWIRARPFPNVINMQNNMR